MHYYNRINESCDSSNNIVSSIYKDMVCEMNCAVTLYITAKTILFM